MTNEQMKRRLVQALDKTAPDDVNGVLSRCDERKGTVNPMTTKKTTKRRWTTLIAACLALVLLGGGGAFYQQAYAVASVVSLDVNPSIELKVSRNERVLTCTALNEDAKAVLADMDNGADLKGAKLDVAVNAIVGSLVRNGYLSSISSAIMISVEDKDTARAEKLQRELMNTVDGVLQTSESRASVLTQTLTQDAGLTRQAQENSISTGKAALVNRVLALNSALKFDALAKLSVEELKDLAEAGAEVTMVGPGGDKTVAAEPWFTRDRKVYLRKKLTDANYIRRSADTQRANVRMLFRSRVEGVDEAGLHYYHNGIHKVAPYDVLIITPQRKRNDELFEALQGIVPEVYKIGDCSKTGLIADAVKAANELLRTI